MQLLKEVYEPTPQTRLSQFSMTMSIFRCIMNYLVFWISVCFAIALPESKTQLLLFSPVLYGYIKIYNYNNLIDRHMLEIQSYNLEIIFLKEIAGADTLLVLTRTVLASETDWRYKCHPDSKMGVKTGKISHIT